MSIFFSKSSPCSLRSGIIAPRGFGSLCGKAVQLSDTFSGHACFDGVPKTLKNEKISWKIYNLRKEGEQEV